MYLGSTHLQIIVAGQDVTSRFQPSLKDVKITRASGEAADTCDLTLSDKNGKNILPGERAPVVVIVNGDLGFTGFVSDVTSNGGKGSGMELELSCSSIDQGSAVKQQQLKHKDDSSLSDFGSQLASAAGLALTVAGSIAGITRPYWLAQQESFMSWGQRIAKEIGASFKIIGDQAYLVGLNEGISASGKPLTPISAIRGINLERWSISPIISRPKFKEVEVSYFDIKKGERVSQKVPTGNSDVDASLRTVIGAANEDQAKNKANGASKSSDREKGAGSITIIGDILAEPEAICNVSGVRPGIDGAYRISSVSHSISKGSGFTSEISLREPQGSAGVDGR